MMGQRQSQMEPLPSVSVIEEVAWKVTFKTRELRPGEMYF